MKVDDEMIFGKVLEAVKIFKKWRSYRTQRPETEIMKDMYDEGF